METLQFECRKCKKGNKAADSQDNRLTATECRNYSMHSVQLYDSCTDRTIKCRSMNLHARCAKSVLKWISQSMRNATHNAAGNQ